MSCELHREGLTRGIYVGLANDLDLKRICKALKKNFRCNGAVVKDDEYGDVIQVSPCRWDVRADLLTLLCSCKEITGSR